MGGLDVMNHAVKNHIVHIGCGDRQTIRDACNHGEILNNAVIATFCIVVYQNNACLAQSCDVQCQGLDQRWIMSGLAVSTTGIVVGE